MKKEGFEGKTAYITGGSSGMGLSTAVRLAREGADVAVFARGRERLEKALEAMESARARDAQRFTFRQLDVTDHQAVERVMEETAAAFGPPDILINSAGRAYPGYFEDIGYEQFDETMKVHAYAAWNTVSALLPHLKQRRGYIVNVTSVLGFMGVFGYTDYCASKFAIVGFSEALRSEMKPHGVRVSVVCPPDTDTPGFATENLTKPAETLAVSEGGGLLQPDEVAEAILEGMRKERFLIGPGSAGRLYRIKRFFPWLIDMVTERQVARARKGSGL